MTSTNISPSTVPISFLLSYQHPFVSLSYKTIELDNRAHSNFGRQSKTTFYLKKQKNLKKLKMKFATLIVFGLVVFQVMALPTDHDINGE
jgi:hypothetical protein